MPRELMKRFKERIAKTPSQLLEQMVRAYQKGQNPHSLVNACSDSRVLPSEVFGARLGRDIFSFENVAGIISPNDARFGAAIAYATSHFSNFKNIVILGHRGCGGMDELRKFALPKKGEKLPSPFVDIMLDAWPARKMVEEALKAKGIEVNDPKEMHNLLIEANTLLQAANTRVILRLLWEKEPEKLKRFKVSTLILEHPGEIDHELKTLKKYGLRERLERDFKNWENNHVKKLRPKFKIGAAEIKRLIEAKEREIAEMTKSKKSNIKKKPLKGKRKARRRR